MTRIEVPQNEFTPELQSRIPLGSTAVVNYISALPLEQRLPAVKTAQKAVFAAAQEGAGLDLYAETMRELIDRGTAGLTKVGTSEEDDKLLDAYNALSFNFAADLADCWPDDVLPREQRHFEAGLRAAEDCVRWRNELNKPPFSFSLAYWAKGMHLLSLGHYPGAVKSFNLGLTSAERVAQDSGKPAGLESDSTFSVLLAHGYLGLAEQLDGSASGAPRYAAAIAAFREQSQSEDAEIREDAEFGIAQLEKVRGKYIR
jgi:hypothetical protein